MEDIELLPKGYKCRCVVCGDSVGDFKDKPFKTLTLGLGPDDLVMTVVVIFCDEHQHVDLYPVTMETFRFYVQKWDERKTIIEKDGEITCQECGFDA